MLEHVDCRLTKNAYNTLELFRMGKSCNEESMSEDAQPSDGNGGSAGQLCEERSGDDENPEMSLESQSRRALDKAYKRMRR